MHAYLRFLTILFLLKVCEGCHFLLLFLVRDDLWCGSVYVFKYACRIIIIV
jgi:hypothetical protein